MQKLAQDLGPKCALSRLIRPDSIWAHFPCFNATMDREELTGRGQLTNGPVNSNFSQKYDFL